MELMESLSLLALSRLMQCFGWGLVFAVFMISTVQDYRKGYLISWPKYLLYNFDRVLSLALTGLYGYLMVTHPDRPAAQISQLINFVTGAVAVGIAWQMARRSVRRPPEIRPTPHNEGITRTVDETPLLQYIRNRWSQDELLAALARLDPAVLRRADQLLSSGEAHKPN
jgi:hypothetical protein